jgi:hypothetical protein
MAPGARSKASCYLPSLKKAWDMLADSDLKTLAMRSGGTAKGNRLSLELLDGNAAVDVENKVIETSAPGSGIGMDIIILHYLKGCMDNDISPNGEWLLFRQMHGGEAYQAAFQKRTVAVIAELFSSRPNVLIDSGMKLKGKAEDFGSATVILDFLPKVHVRVTVWQGDDEVPGNATMLFSPGSGSLLPTEDLAEVGSLVLSALLRTSS